MQDYDWVHDLYLIGGSGDDFYNADFCTTGRNIIRPRMLPGKKRSGYRHAMTRLLADLGIEVAVQVCRGLPAIANEAVKSDLKQPTSLSSQFQVIAYVSS